MRQPKLIDYILLTTLSLIWASAFFNIKIATYSFGPVTIAFLRVFFGAIPVLLLCYYKNIKIEAFSKDWHWFAMIGFINLVAPFFLIAYGVKSVQSNLAAILMSTTPLSSTVLGHFFTKNEKFNLIKTFGILIGFSGIVFLFSDNILIDENNFTSALLILLGSTCYVVGGVLTLKISKKKNENVTGSILIWAIIYVRAFGLGPFAGLLSIFTADVGTLGKLFSEATDNADKKQIEGITATGSNKSSIIRYGLIPQIFPIFISQSLYFFESNTRSAVILGVVGAGGIGLQLTERMKAQYWDQTLFIIVLILIMVAIIDSISRAIRKRIIYE